LKDQRNEF